MRIKSLHLSNFKAIKDEVFNFGGASASIYGVNGSGKTTIADAWDWLWTDKDSLGQGDFEIKPLKLDGEATHNLESTVESVIDLEDGREIELRKVYSECWTKPRGCAEKQLTSHKTDHYVNGQDVKSKTAYQARLAEIVDKEAFQLLSSPSFFAKDFHWTKRRNLVLALCGGDIDDSVIIGGDLVLIELMKRLKAKGLSVGVRREIILDEQTKLKKEIDKIPIQIAEAQRGRPDTSKLFDGASLEKAIAKKKAVICGLQAEKATLEAGGGIAEKQKELAEVDAAIAVLEKDHTDTVAGILKEKRVELRASETARVTLLSQDVKFEGDYAGLKVAIEDTERTAAALRFTFREAKNKPLPSSCYACGQDLPLGSQEAAKEKQLTEMNAAGKELISKNKQRGKALTDIEKERGLLAEKTATKTKEVEVLEAEIKRIQESKLSSEERYKLSELKAAAQNAISFFADGNTKPVAEIEQKIEAAQSDHKGLRDQIDSWKRSAEIDERIAEIGSEQKTLTKTFEGLKEQLSVIDNFTRQRVKLLQSKQEAIDGRFKLAKFRMFELQGNGVIKDCCEVMAEGVPYDGNLNGAARVQVGCDVIQTLTKYYFPAGQTLPLFIDGRESVIELPEMDCQVISLIASNDIEVEINFPDLLGWGQKGERVWISPDQATMLKILEAVTIIPKPKDDKTLRIVKEELST